MKSKGPPKQCKGCCHFWAHGIKDGVHDRWCCNFGKAADKAVGHCKIVGGFSVSDKSTADDRHF